MVGCAVRMYVKGQFDSKRVCLSRFPAILKVGKQWFPLSKALKMTKILRDSTEVFENV